MHISVISCATNTWQYIICVNAFGFLDG